MEYSTEKKFFRRAQDNSQEKSFEFWRVSCWRCGRGSHPKKEGLAGGVAGAHVLRRKAWLPVQPPPHPGGLSNSPPQELTQSGLAVCNSIVQRMISL